MKNASVLEKLVGSWSLVSWESYSTDGSKSYPLANQRPFTSDDWREATPQEMTAAWPNYFGYFGTFTIDVDNAAVTHHIESGWFPNLVGTQQVRYFRFDGDRLVLDADTAWDRVRIVWEREPLSRR